MAAASPCGRDGSAGAGEAEGCGAWVTVAGVVLVQAVSSAASRADRAGLWLMGIPRSNGSRGATWPEAGYYPVAMPWKGVRGVAAGLLLATAVRAGRKVNSILPRR